MMTGFICTMMRLRQLQYKHEDYYLVLGAVGGEKADLGSGVPGGGYSVFRGGHVLYSDV